MLKKVLVLFMVSILVFMLAACGQDPEPTSTPTATPKEEITLKFPTHWAGEDPVSVGLKKLTDEFNAANKGDVQVELVGIPEYTNALNNVKTSFAADQAVDIFFVQEATTTEAFWGYGKLADLSKYIEADADFKASKSQELWNEFTTSDGQIVGVPFFGITVPMFYNKELFAQAGITDPVFKTWDDFYAAADKLKAEGITPVAAQTLGTAWTSMLMYSAFVGGQEGPNYVKGISNFDAAGWTKGAEMLLKLKDYTTVDALGGDYTVAANNFVNGKAAMIANGPWMIQSFIDAGVYDKIGIMPYPGEVFISGPNGSIATSKQNESDPAKMEAIVKYVKYLTSNESLKELTIASGTVFAGTFEVTADEVDPLVAELTSYFSKYKAVNQARDAVPAAFGTAIEEELSSLWSGSITAEEFVTNLEAKTFAK